MILSLTKLGYELNPLAMIYIDDVLFKSSPLFVDVHTQSKGMFKGIFLYDDAKLGKDHSIVGTERFI